MSKEKFLVIDENNRVIRILTNPSIELSESLTLIPLTKEVEALLKKGNSILDLAVKDGNIVLDVTDKIEAKGITNIPNKYKYDDTELLNKIHDLEITSGLKYFENKADIIKFQKNNQDGFETIQETISKLYLEQTNQTNKIEELDKFFTKGCLALDKELNKLDTEITKTKIDLSNLNDLYVGLSAESLSNIKSINILENEKDLLKNEIKKLKEELKKHKEEPIKSNNKLILSFILALIISTILGIIF